MRPMSRTVLVASAAILTLTACSSSDGKGTSSGPDTTKGTSTKLVEVSPVTGKQLPQGRPDNPVLVVKVENTDGGAPQYGLDKADMVVEELVEGGLTRLAAFYYSTLPTKVGHVRSMRASDIGIASPVGGQIIASGGSAGTIKKIKKAGVKVISEDEGAAGFSSDPNKVRPYNRLINLKTVAKNTKATRINGPYLPWGANKPAATPSAGAATTAPTTATSATVRFSNSTRTEWKLKGSTWERTNGHADPGHDFAADTLLVMSVKVGDAGYLDPAGNPVPETELKGSGKATVLRGRTATRVTWSKSSLTSPIVLRSADGAPFRIAPGHVFLELIPKDGGSIELG